LEARAGLTRPILVHAILETARGVANVEEICGRLAAHAGHLARPRRPRRGPPDEDHPRRWRAPRLSRARGPVDGASTARAATFQQDLWHYTIARMVDACAMHGIFPFYGPFGDIKDVVACEDQFRNAFLLGCVGAWSLHPVQIAIAKKVFSPSAADVAHARRVKAAMGDGTGAVMLDGKMEDDASLKQCLVILELAEQLSASDPERWRRCMPRLRRVRPARARGSRRERGIPASSVGALYAGLERAGAGEGQDDPV
jgi:malyl-CoA/(S)-citramalyl-CoA lyase